MQDLVDVVAEDLTYCDTDWHERVDARTMRKSSPVLRRLLADGDWARAWRQLGLPGEPRLLLATPPGALERDDPTLTLATTGGATYGGMQIQGVTLWSRALTPAEIKAAYESGRGKTAPRLVTVSTAMDEISMAVKGSRVKRGRIIRYVANKLGGTHFDESRDFKGKDELDYRALDATFNGMKIGGTMGPEGALSGQDVVFFELLSIGQGLAKSPDVPVFLDAYRSTRTKQG